MTQVETNSDHQCVEESSLVARQRAAIARLKSLVADRSEVVERLTRLSKSERTSIERTYREKREAFESEHRAAMEKLRREHMAERDAEARQLDAAYEKLDKQYRSEQFRVKEQAENDTHRTKKSLEEARWTAETVYEAKEPQPREEYRRQKKVLNAKLSAIESIVSHAQSTFRRYRHWLPAQVSPAVTAIESGADEKDDPLSFLNGLIDDARAQLESLRRSFFARQFEGIKPLLILLIPFVIAGAAWGHRTSWRFDDTAPLPLYAGLAGIAGLSMLVVVYVLGRRQLVARYEPLLDLVAKCRDAHEVSKQHVKAVFQRESEALREERDNEIQKAESKYKPRIEKIRSTRASKLKEFQQTFEPKLQIIERDRDEKLRSIDASFEDVRCKCEQQFNEHIEQVEQERTESLASLEDRLSREWEALEQKWNAGIARTQATVLSLRELDKEWFPAWSDDIWHVWEPPEEPAPAIRFGSLEIDVARMEGGAAQHDRLPLDEALSHTTMPAILDFPSDTSLMIEVGDSGRDLAVQTMQSVMLRLLTCLPPGKVRFTIFDPIGLGQNFAGFMHLADFDDSFVADRIWTESKHIEQRLTDLTEHMENVIQKYLRNDFESITEYNRHAGEIAEPFRFLVIANFPANFSDQAARRLLSVIESGRRCGVYTLLSMETRQKMPQGIHPDDLRSAGGVQLVAGPDGLRLRDEVLQDLPLTIDEPPSPTQLNQIIRVVGERAQDSTRVEVPFEHVVPKDNEIWSYRSARQLTVPLGRAGATKLQELALGRGMAQHVLIAGKTGSGKSTLLHVLVTNLALRFSPDEVEFYLVDFKKGVEFKTYATHNLPHARVVAIESDREFGLSVLQRVDAELKRRGELFRKLGVQDLAGYRQTAHGEPIPRTLLIIDEFQEFFVEDDKLAQDAGLLLDRLVRQGRAFGIHVLLGSQTLSGAYTLARSTIGQMAVRVALQCTETDAMLIMGDDNTAPRLLSRPGEAIYNDQGGLMEGNNPFQIVWLPERTREKYLQKIERVAEETGYEPKATQIVFEGNVPAEIARNPLLAKQLCTDAPSTTPRAWLGEAIAIKDPTASTFRRQSGANLLMVGQQAETTLALFATGLISLASQTSDQTARFYVLDATPDDAQHAGYLTSVAERLPHDIRIVTWPEIDQAMAEIGDELIRRQEANRTDAPPLFILINGVQRYRMLRTSEEFGFSMSESERPATPDKHLAAVLRDGPPLGMHTMVWCDSANNLSRTFDRSTLREFDLRVLFQMSGTDSSALIDTPIASQLGQNRAFFFSEDEGVLEKFRPYALPSQSFLSQVQRSLLKHP